MIAIVIATGVFPGGAAYAASGGTAQGVYELTVKPNSGTAFTKNGVAGTISFKTVPNAKVASWKTDPGDTSQYYLTLPSGMEFAPGAEQVSAVCGSATCRMDSDRRHLYIDISFPGSAVVQPSTQPLVSLPVVSKGRITGTARVVYKPFPKLKSDAPCVTTNVPTDPEPESFDVLKALARAYPGQNLSIDDVGMDTRSVSVTQSNEQVSEQPLKRLLDVDNATQDTHTWTSAGESYSETTTETLSHEHGYSLGAKFGNTTTLKFSIVEASFTWEMNMGEQSNSIETVTKTTTKTVTYPSQPLTVRPGYHGRLDYMRSKVHITGKLRLDGAYTGTVSVSNCDGSNARKISVGTAFTSAAKFLPDWVHSDATYSMPASFTTDGSVKEYTKGVTWPIGLTEASSKATKNIKIIAIDPHAKLK
ncbi:ETX/MTX2 family pore-forming toxin [Microbacterium testaceum]|uniref:ETX/MTX2 family pore-forming toxin n=1 Tax=Microbacterium testaceum TaxID=2033 RepID=UPI00343E8FA3